MPDDCSSPIVPEPMRCAALALLVLSLGLMPSLAQPPPASQAPADSARYGSEDAWTPIATRNGVAFSYIFYAKADNKNNGVVIRLDNRNAYPVRYAFTVIFRVPTAERTAEAKGTIGARAMKTGAPDGLFWIPFPDGRTIGEIGLRSIDIVRLREQ